MIFREGMSEEQYKQAVYASLFQQDYKSLTYMPNYGRSKIDFVIADAKDHTRHLLWAEAKNEKTHFSVMLTQLLLTVKSTFFSGEVIPPAYLAVFDPEELHLFNTADFTEFFFRNDIEWKTRPSDHKNPRFKELQDLVNDYARAKLVVPFKYDEQVNNFKSFIRGDFLKQVEVQGIEITLANLNHVFNEWVDKVKPQINLTDVQWKEYMQKGIYAADFFLADAYVGNTEDATLVDGLKVGILGTTYFVKIESQQLSLYDAPLKRVNFKDGGKAYREFWKRYKRPPRNVRAYDNEKTPWEQILLRRDILVPRDIMERKGAFFTPRIWVTKAHDYLAEVLGDNWQDEYVIYDCCAGSGNLLSGLINQRNVYASDIDEQNVRIMIEETKPTFAANIFKFDFLNDEFIRQSDGGLVPDGLMDVLEDPEKRKKLVVLINPPYVGVGNQTKGKGKGKRGANISKLQEKYADVLGMAVTELYAQFLARIYGEFRGCIIAEFSTLKVLQASNFKRMREWFKPKLLASFLVPGYTFDNVKGKFPIGFKIWDTSIEEKFMKTMTVVYEGVSPEEVASPSLKCIVSYDDVERINVFSDKYLPQDDGKGIGCLHYCGTDFQQQGLTDIQNAGCFTRGIRNRSITEDNIFHATVYFSVRWAVEANWVNHYDQFLNPKIDPIQDIDFVNNCLVFAIFEGHNHVSVEYGDNHWIPFTEQELGVTVAPFKHSTLNRILVSRGITLNSRILSAEAKAALKAGYDIFKYYHAGNAGKPFPSSPDGTGGVYNHNAALYDIRKFFQGVNPNGHMKVKSEDEIYNNLIETLREKLKELRDKCIVPKVYEYGFLIVSEQVEV